MKYTIWSNIDLNLDDWREDLLENNPDLTEEQMYYEMESLNDDYLGNERANLSVETPNGIIAIADIGRWDGRRIGYKDIRGNKISDCLFADEDYVEWYVDDEFRCTAHHHDGTNYIMYRAWKPEIGEDAKEDLRWAIYEGKADQADIDRCTYSLAETIANVYGWEMNETVPA